MPQGFWYWLILVVWMILAFIGLPPITERRWYHYGVPVVLFVLLCIIGVTLYGGAYHNLVK